MIYSHVSKSLKKDFLEKKYNCFFSQIRRGKHIPLSEVLKMEYRLVRRCCEDSDFYEGVRAVLVDRDNDPKWNPSDLEDVSDKMVDRYFSMLPDDEELKL